MTTFPALAILVSIFALASPALPETWIVDDDGLAGPDGCASNVPALGSIQGAVNVALPGDTILVCPGTYDEQIEILVRDVTIRGSGRGRTIVRPSRVEPRTSRLSDGAPVAAIVVADGIRNVTITDLTVDGAEAAFDACTPGYVGVYYRGASGAVRRTAIHDVLHGRARHCESVHAILVEGDETPPRPAGPVVIEDNRLDRFGKSGITAEAPDLEVRLTGNTIRGRGAVGPSDAAQTGIRIAVRDGSLVDGNRISGHRHVSREVTGCGISVSADGRPTGRNHFWDNERNVCRGGPAS